MKVKANLPRPTIPVTPAARALIDAAGLTEVDEKLLSRYLTDAARFEGDKKQLSPDETRIGVANYLAATGHAVLASQVRGSYAGGPDALGYSIVPQGTGELPAQAQPLLPGAKVANDEVTRLAKKVGEGITGIDVLGNHEGASTRIFKANAGGEPVFLRAFQGWTGLTHRDAD